MAIGGEDAKALAEDDIKIHAGIDQCFKDFVLGDVGGAPGE